MEGTQPIEWLTVADVAKLLDLAPKTVYVLSSLKCQSERRIPAARLGPRGGKLRFDRADVERYIEDQKCHGKVTPPRRTLQCLEPRVRGSKRRAAK